MAGVQQFTLRSGQPEAEVALGDVPATVSVSGGTVYYRDEPGVTSVVNDGSIASGSSTTLSGTQFFSTTAARADVTVVQSGVGNVRVVDERLSFTDPRIGGQAADSNVDNGPKFATAYALMPFGGELFFPAGNGRVYGCATAPAAVPGGVLLSGTGFDYSEPTTAPPKYASVIAATAAMSRLIQLGGDSLGGSTTPGDPGASIERLSLDGRDLADTVVKTSARRNEIRNCQVYWGLLQAVWFAGQNSIIRGGVFNQHNVGDCVLIDSYYDHKIFDAQLRQPGTTGACVRGKGTTADLVITGCHMWAGANGIPLAAQGLIVLDTFVNNASIVNVAIENNIIEGVLGPEIALLAHGNGTSLIRAVKISGNQFFAAGGSLFTDITYPVLYMDGPGTVHTVVVGNTIEGVDSTHRYKALVEYGPAALGSTSHARAMFDNNAGTFVAALTSGTGPATAMPWGENAIQNGSATVYTSNRGRSTFSGTGAQTAFTIAHGLAAAPGSIRVTPGSSAAAAAFFVSADATNITVTFTVAPANGASNVVLNWQAEV